MASTVQAGTPMTVSGDSHKALPLLRERWGFFVPVDRIALNLPKCSENGYDEHQKTKIQPQEIQAMNTRKLTLGQAAKHARRAKGTLSKALSNGQISASKDDKGRWQIDPSELQRWMEANPLQNGSENQDTTPMETPKNPNGNSALAVEVKMLREQIERSDGERERERQQLSSQIEDLREQLERQSADHRQALAVLTDQRQGAEETTTERRKGLWGRLFSSGS